MAAAAKGHKDVVQTLFKYGADVLAVMDKVHVHVLSLVLLRGDSV